MKGLLQGCLQGALTAMVACKWHVPSGLLDVVHHPRDCQLPQQARLVVPWLEVSDCELEEAGAIHITQSAL